MSVATTPALFAPAPIEARHLMKGATVRTVGGGPTFAVTRVDPLGATGLLISGRNARHGGLVEIACDPSTRFEVAR